MNRKSLLGWSVGLLLLALVLWRQDYAALGAALRNAGFWLLLVLLFEPLLWLSHALAWQPLFPAGQRARFGDVLFATAVANAVNNLLPVFAVGGDLLKARHVARRGVTGSDAVAAGIVDLSLHGVSALGWSLIGLTLLVAAAGAGDMINAGLIAGTVIGAVLAALIGVQLLASERLASSLARRFRRRGWNVLARDTGRAQRRLVTIWRQRVILARSILLRMLGRALMVPEIMFVGWLLGDRITTGQAMLITGMVILVKTISFVIPARLGIQEGTFVVAGALAGLSEELMFAVALSVRLRETLANSPVLLFWYWGEWRHSAMRESIRDPR